jgi:hypothetical protein
VYPFAIRTLAWSDVDPTTRRFDPAAARRVATELVTAAAAGDPRALDRDALADDIDRALLAEYGAWVAGWRWSTSEPGCGGPVRSWCCGRDSLLRADDVDPTTSIERVTAAVVEWHAFLGELASLFDAIDDATAGLVVDAVAERAAARLLPLVVERTEASDAWYATFATFLTWYLQRRGVHAPDVASAIDRVTSGHFASWCAPSADTAAAASAELGAVVATAAAAIAPIDGLAAWLAIRPTLRAWNVGTTRPVREDGHLRYIEARERGPDYLRAIGLYEALVACRASARRGEPLTFERLAEWQGIALDTSSAGAFRATDAFARGGRERYPITPDTRARFEAVLAQANDAGVRPALRAARAYLDVCYFHPFVDGNARAARLALDHVLTSAGLTLHAAEPIFLVSRPAADRAGADAFAWLVDYLAGSPAVPLSDAADAPRTVAEAAFLSVLLARCPHLDVWEHRRADGAPWLIVSHDFSVDRHIHDVVRLDFDGASICGGWSLQLLNGDDGVSAADAGIATNPPDGLPPTHGEPAHLAAIAATWFEHHLATWSTGPRSARWR